MEGEINLDFYHINLGWAPIFEHINRNLKYLDERYCSLLKEYTQFKKGLCPECASGMITVRVADSDPDTSYYTCRSCGHEWNQISEQTPEESPQ